MWAGPRCRKPEKRTFSFRETISRRTRALWVRASKDRPANLARQSSLVACQQGHRWMGRADMRNLDRRRARPSRLWLFHKGPASRRQDRGLRAVESHSRLSAFPDQSQRIIKALLQWRFKPYLRDGAPLEVETGISFGYVRHPRAPPQALRSREVQEVARVRLPS